MTSVRKKNLTPLRPGDIVDVIAPGFGCTPEALSLAREYLTKQGFVPRIPENILGDHPLHSNTDANRERMLVNALKARDSKAIWCLRGGYGSNRLLKNLAKLKPQAPKLFIGISDITSLHGFLMQNWKWTGPHGTLLDRLGKGMVPQDVEEELLQVVCGEVSEVVFQNLQALNKSAAATKRIKAKVSGGNLTVIAGHIGTKNKFNFAKKIAFFEDTGERGYRIDRMLSHLTEAGAFKDVAAVVFGTFIGGEEPAQGSAPRVSKVDWVLKNWASEQKFPVLAGLPCGHDTVQRVLPLGTWAHLETGKKANLHVETGIGK